MAEQGYHDYKCPNCGGPLKFRGDLNKMACEYCDSTFDMAEFQADTQVKTEESDWSQGQAKPMDSAGVKEYSCNTCGAVLVAEENLGATECPYCGNPLVIKDTFEGMNLPDGVIPFAVDKQSAQEAMRNFYKGKKLLPKGFVDNNRIDHVKGLYVPFWLFDCKTRGDGFYRCTQKNGYDQKVRQGGQETVERWTEVKEYAVSRSATMDFEKVPADASKEMNDAYMDSLEPYDYSKITDYNAAYFSGYVASKYDEEVADVKERVDARIRSTVKDEIRDTVKGYDTVDTESCQVDIREGKIHYCMLPVWMLSTKYNGEVYSFAMNGQTGKVTGNLPVDKNLATGYFFKISIITMLVAQLILWLMGSFQNENLLMYEGVALLASLVVGALALSSAKAAMVSHMKTEAKHYLVKDSFRLQSRNDRYLGVHYEPAAGSSGGVPVGGPAAGGAGRPGAGPGGRRF